jgi:hypothetical protein
MGLYLLAGSLLVLLAGSTYMSVKQGFKSEPIPEKDIDAYLDRLNEREEIDESQVW